MLVLRSGSIVVVRVVVTRLARVPIKSWSLTGKLAHINIGVTRRRRCSFHLVSCMNLKKRGKSRVKRCVWRENTLCCFDLLSLLKKQMRVLTAIKNDASPTRQDETMQRPEAHENFRKQ